MPSEDGIAEGSEGMLRAALTVAGLAAETIIEQRRRRMRDAQERDMQEAERDRRHIEAERAMSRARLATAMEGDWTRADAREIADLWAEARAWQGDPWFDRQREEIERHIRDRCGIDVRGLPTRDALERALARGDLTASDEDREAARRLGEQADRLDARETEQERDGAPAAQVDGTQNAYDAARDGEKIEYDSAGRRERMAARLRGDGASEEDVQSMVRADQTHATPAVESTGRRARRNAARPKTAGRAQARTRGASLGR